MPFCFASIKAVFCDSSQSFCSTVVQVWRTILPNAGRTLDTKFVLRGRSRFNCFQIRNYLFLNYLYHLFLSLSMTFKSGANTSFPPPINRANNPKPNPVNVNISNKHLLDHHDVEESNSGTPAPRLVPVFINSDHIADLREAMRCHSESSHRQLKLELQEDTIIDDAGNVKRVFFIRQPSTMTRHSQHAQEDAHVDVSLSSENPDLASTFSRLSMSTPSPGHRHVTKTDAVTPTLRNSAPSPMGIRTAPGTISASGLSQLTSPRKRRYYVVLVGKCAGIYYDEWQVFSAFSVCLHFMIVHSSREKVEPLIRHVSGARYKGFSIYDMAMEFYLNAKQENKVRIVRDPGDDAKYGPIKDAVQ